MEPTISLSISIYCLFFLLWYLVLVSMQFYYFEAKCLEKIVVGKVIVAKAFGIFFYILEEYVLLLEKWVPE